MDTTILQIPVKKEFRDKVSRVVKETGFSSLQDYIRFVMKLTLENRLEVKIIYKEN